MIRAAKLVAWIGGTYAAALMVALLTVLILGAGLSDAEADAFRRILEQRAPALLFAALLMFIACTGALRWLFAQYVQPVRALAEQTRVLRTANADLRIAARGVAEFGELASAINGLADAYRELRRDCESRAAEARARLEEERNRLAALMSELAEGVVVCNAEGTILLYNEQARALFATAHAGSRQPPVGLGRSLFGLIDRAQVAHAVHKMERSLERGERLPRARFVSANRAGRLLKVQAAPFLDADARRAGMVFTLEDVTPLLERESQRRSLLQILAARIRASAANMRAAAENLAAWPEMEAQRRAQFIDIVVAESRTLSATINEALSQYADALKAGLALEDMRADDLLDFARARIEDLLGVAARASPAGQDVWLRVDSYALVQALVHFAGRLRDECDVRAVELQARPADGFVHLDLGWGEASVPSGVLSVWEAQPMEAGTEGTPLTVRDVMEQHGGEVWEQRGQGGGARYGCFRFLLPGGTPAQPTVHISRAPGSRPEYYDFDLFGRASVPESLNEAKLATLSFTAFDTETTGLEPSAGDEIISIGAVRIVNGRLLRGEVFEKLVDPRRPLDPRSARVHRLDAAALAGQPTIAEVLPQFHRFCEDTVLVAHNAAFDMRFLELKRPSTGVRFAQPVLDTLLLSAALHPSLEDHSLEAIAERLGVSVIGRHTALGDALLTAEIFLKLLPLLDERGIATLGQALEISRRTYHARIQY
jgi:DNA polymerase III subunit epsilon